MGPSNTTTSAPATRWTRSRKPPPRGLRSEERRVGKECPVCLATMGLYVAGGVSAGGIMTYLAARLLRRRRDQPEGRGEER